jgi:thiamine biosynthesis lipoprotein
MAIGLDSVRRARPLLGTFVEIAVTESGSADANAAIEAAFNAVAKIHQLMSFHDPDSDVSRLNSKAFTQSVIVNRCTYQVLETAIDLHRGSNGLFDIAVAPALQRLGLLPAQSSTLPSTSMTRATTEMIEFLPGCRVRFRHPQLRIDLGGIAKGYAVDCAVEVLRSYGIESGIVNAGGDLSVFGTVPHIVHIRDPRCPERLFCQVMVRNQALASSGSCFDPIQSWEPAASAVIDPASQRPACRIRGATVRASSCVVADALTKIVMLAGEGSKAHLERYCATAIFVVADGAVLMSADWQEDGRFAA